LSRVRPLAAERVLSPRAHPSVKFFGPTGSHEKTRAPRRARPSLASSSSLKERDYPGTSALVKIRNCFLRFMSAFRIDRRPASLSLHLSGCSLAVERLAQRHHADHQQSRSKRFTTTQ